MRVILFRWLWRPALVLVGLALAIGVLTLFRLPYLLAPDLEPSRKPTVAELSGLYQMPDDSFELTADEKPSYLMLREDGTFAMRGVPSFVFQDEGRGLPWVWGRNDLSGTWDISWNEDIPYRKSFVQLRVTQMNDMKCVLWYKYHLHVQGNSAPYDIHCFLGQKDKKKWVFRRTSVAGSKYSGSGYGTAVPPEKSIETDLKEK